MPITEYTTPIGHKYGETLPFAEERDDIKIGVWIWVQSGNNRHYPPYAGGKCIIEGHYEAVCVVNETNTHWHLASSPDSTLVTKVKKDTLQTATGDFGASSYYTLNEMLDSVWMSYNRLLVEQALKKCRDDEALAKVLESLDGCNVFDYERYLQQEGRRRHGKNKPLSEAIAEAIHNDMWHHTPSRSRTFIYRNIANAIGYEDVERSDLKLWQEDREKRRW